MVTKDEIKEVLDECELERQKRKFHKIFFNPKEARDLFYLVGFIATVSILINVVVIGLDDTTDAIQIRNLENNIEKLTEAYEQSEKLRDRNWDYYQEAQDRTKALMNYLSCDELKELSLNDNYDTWHVRTLILSKCV